MSRSVGSGPMPHADTAATPAPVTPRTFTNRRRLMGSVMSVVAHGAIAAHFFFDVAADAPPHLQGRDLVDLRHGLHVAVAIRARSGPQRLDVAHVREPHEPRQRVDASPLRRLPRSEEHTSELQSPTNLVCRL